jgi:hypothetical protein
MAAAAMFAASGGCSSLTSLSPQPVDGSFLRSDGQFWTQNGSHPITTLVKAFERDGKVALCGAYVVDGGSFAQLAVTRQLWRQDVMIDTVPLGTASFFRVSGVGDDPAGRVEADCVATAVPWEPRFARSVVRIADRSRL